MPLSPLVRLFRRLLGRADTPPPEPRTATYAAAEGLIEITAPPEFTPAPGRGIA